MKNQTKLGENEEIRGFRIRLYPTREQVETLMQFEVALKGVWNTLVKYREEADQARTAHAVREGLVPARPVRPDLNGLEPEASKEVTERHREASRAWFREVREATKALPGRSIKDLIDQFGGPAKQKIAVVEGETPAVKKHDYQALQRFATWKQTPLGAHMLQKLAKDYQAAFVKGRRPPQFKRAVDPMPIGVRSTVCLDVGTFGARGGREGWYDARISMGGLRILGRLPGRKPPGRVLEGVSIKREAGGQWYAAVKVACERRILRPPIPGTVVGIDVGLDNIAAIVDGDGTLVPAVGLLIGNPRDRAWDEKIENLRMTAEDTGDERHARRASREETRGARRARHEIYNRVFRAVELAEVIAVEKLAPHIGHMAGSRKSSVMRLVVSMLKSRFGDRVREVPAPYTSRDCSSCGPDPETRANPNGSWSYAHGPIGECLRCGHSEHRDINAARNIRLRYLTTE